MFLSYNKFSILKEKYNSPKSLLERNSKHCHHYYFYQKLTIKCLKCKLFIKEKL